MMSLNFKNKKVKASTKTVAVLKTILFKLCFLKVENRKQKWV